MTAALERSNPLRAIPPAKVFMWGFALCLFYMPNAHIPQLRAVAIGLLAALMVVLVSARVQRSLFVILLIGFAASISMLFSVMVNTGSEQVFGAALMAIFKPVFFSLVLVFGYLCTYTSRLSSSQVREVLTSIVVVFVVSQLAIALLQGLGLAGALGGVYAQEKTRGFETIMRATGTMGNPNSLAFFALQSFLLVLLVGTLRGMWRAVVLAMAAGLVLLSGSRSVAIVLVLCLLVFLFFRKKTVAAWMVYGAMIPIVVGAGWLFIDAYAEHFRYLSQIGALLSDDPIGEIRSLSTRFSHWAQSVTLFVNHPGAAKYWFGLGVRPEFRVMDNDYLYVLLRHGLIGVLFFYGFYLALWMSYGRAMLDSASRFFGRSVFLSSVVLAMMFEIFADWYHMTFFIFLTGTLLGVAGKSPVNALVRGKLAECSKPQANVT